MKARRDIERRIEREQQKIADLKSQIEYAEAFIQGLQEALKVLPKHDNDKARKGKGTIRPGSDMARIRDLIKKTGRPMYIGEIVKGLGREDTKANRTSIAGSLGRYVRLEVVFKRVKPNTFALIDMDSVPEAEPPPDVELPQDFGAEEIGSNHPANSPDF
jgi:hypothetical protein